MTDPCVVAGLFTSEILDMTTGQRKHWYKTLAPEEHEMAKRVVGRVGRIKISESKTGENNHNFGKTLSEEYRAKISEALSGENNPMKRPEVRAKHKKSMKRPEVRAKLSRTLNSPEVRAKRIRVARELWKQPEYRAKISEASKEMWQDPEYRAKMSELRSGESNPNWKGGASFEPYCPAFNISRKEHTRNRYNRTCVVCGKSALQHVNGGGRWLGRLSVHHLDEEKMQGCEDWEWRLAVLCKSCHTRMHNQDLTRLLQLLLLNNRWHQTSLLWGDEP